VSQPFDRTCCVPAPGKLDPALKEFWVQNPWDIVVQGHNLSSFERNRVFLNVEGRNFVEISHLTGADSEGDGRVAVAADFRNVGRMDLLVRQVGGGPLFLWENQFPPRNYLKVSLRGRPQIGRVPTSNRQGIGARLIAEVHGRQIVREMMPLNSYNSQAPCLVHFGLNQNAQVDRLTIHWPSGEKQVLAAIPANRHILVTEGSPQYEVVEPGRVMAP
jgi:hypothetical protein